MAAGARVLDGHDDRVGRVGGLPHPDLVAADGVVVGVAGVVLAHRHLGERGDELGVLVQDTAGTEADAGGVEGALAVEDGGGLGGDGEEGEQGQGSIHD